MTLLLTNKLRQGAFIGRSIKFIISLKTNVSVNDSVNREISTNNNNRCEDKNNEPTKNLSVIVRSEFRKSPSMYQ